MDVLKRSIPTTIERTDKRTLECRIVPWHVRAVAVDQLPDGKIDKYYEEFGPTAFDRQLKAAEKGGGPLQRITLVDQHHDGLGKVGFTVKARREDDGFYGTIRLLPTKVEDVEAMLEEGINKLSVEFIPHRGGTKFLDDGTRVRNDAHLFRVALEAEGAYEGAEVLALRDADDMVAEVAAEHGAYMDDLQSFLAAENAKQQEWNQRLGV